MSIPILQIEAASGGSSRCRRRPVRYRRVHGSRTSDGRSHQSGSTRHNRQDDSVAAEFSAHVVCEGENNCPLDYENFEPNSNYFSVEEVGDGRFARLRI